MSLFRKCLAIFRVIYVPDTVFRAGFLFFLLCSAVPASFANESACDKLGAKANASGIGYYPSAEAVIIGNKRVNFYTAPSAECKMKGVFVFKGDYLTLYKSYKGWVSVMFVGKNGESVEGWVQESKVNTVGQYGRNP